MPRITQIQNRRDTAANWTSTNPTLAQGEIGFETDTGKFKFGNGSSTWTALNYAAGAGLTTSDTAPSSPVAGAQWFNSTTGKTYVYYADANSSQWVELDSQGTNSSSTGNAIINGAFDIWQRGTSISTTGGYTADRWRLENDKAGSVTQQTFTPGTAPVAGYEGQFYARVAYTATGSYGNFFQKVEDVRTFAGQTVTLSFWAKTVSGTATTGAIRLEQNFGSGGSATVTTTGTSITMTSSWVRYTQTFTVPSIAGKTIGTGSYLGVFVPPTAYPDATAATFDIWGVQLEAGSVATPFKRNAPSIQAELATCQRFGFTRTGTAYETIGTGIGLSSTLVRMIVQPPVPMRTYPTSVEWSTLRLENPVTGATTPVTNVTISWGGSGNLVSVDVATASGLTAGAQYTLQCNNSATGYFRLNVEL